MFPQILSHFKKKSKRGIQKGYIQKNLFGDTHEKYFRKKKSRSILLFLQKIHYFHSSLGKQGFLLGFFGICLFLIIFGIFGPFLKIQQIFIFREDNIININQAYSSVEYIRGKNILFLNSNEIVDRIQKRQKSIQNISFKVDFPNTLNIELKSYLPVFQTPKYIILENGIAVKKENIPENTPHIILSQDISKISNFGKKLNIQDLKNIKILLEELPKNILGFSPQVTQYYISEKEVLISNKGGTIFIFDLTVDVKKQVKNLAVYQKESSNIAEKKYIYVDVRIPKKLFLCGYESEFHCKQTLKNIYNSQVFTHLESDSSQSPQ